LSEPIQFFDRGAAVTHDKLGIAEGIPNGPAFRAPKGATYVPLWCERSDGREPTTIYVKTTNLLDSKLKAEFEATAEVE